jgi:branched-chain amino acid transport system ATP-binding protein
MADHGHVLSLGKVVAQGPAVELASDSRLLHAYLGVA